MISFACLFLIAGTLLTDSSLGSMFFLEEPQNVFICEGGNALFPCTYQRIYGIPVWHINDTSYNWEEIEAPNHFNTATFSINVDRVPLWMNATRYKCSVPGYGESRTGVLYVEPLSARCFVPRTSILTHISNRFLSSESLTLTLGTDETNVQYINEETTPYLLPEINYTTSQIQKRVSSTPLTIADNSAIIPSEPDRIKLIGAGAAVSLFIGSIIIILVPILVFCIKRKNNHTIHAHKDHIYDEIEIIDDGNIHGTDGNIIKLHSNECYEGVVNTNIIFTTSPAYSSQYEMVQEIPLKS